MSTLTDLISSPDPAIRNQSLDSFACSAALDALLAEEDALEQFRAASDNLYHRVRALFFLSAIHRYRLPFRTEVAPHGPIPFDGHEHLLHRRFEEAIRSFRAAQSAAGPNQSISSALAAAYRGLAFQTLADQVRRSVRAEAGNQWMFRTGHPSDYPLRLRPELLRAAPLFPILRETTPVRMDLSHSGWSDIFFLAMDFPEGARVFNTSINLSLGDAAPTPPVEAWLRVIDQPVLRLASVDLGAVIEITALADVFDFARDYLGLLKAAVIASGLVPPGLEGSTHPLPDLLERLTGRPGHGLEVVSQVNNIPKGSRLAVSTTLLASLIAALMRATGQARSLTGPLDEPERRIVAARAILGEWLGGSGGGWQDSGGVWPGMKLISGAGRETLLPNHRIFSLDEISPATRQALQDSLVLVHGGMAQDVGPILEMVTEKYLLRSEPEWQARQQAIRILDNLIDRLKAGDIRSIGRLTQSNFDGPIQTIIPWASNLFTESLIAKVRSEFNDDFWGFWMLGGMSGGGMGFLFAPSAKPRALAALPRILGETKRSLHGGIPFAMEPVVYNFSINETGTSAELLSAADALMPAAYYSLAVPALVRQEQKLLSPARRAELDHFGEACRTRPELAGMVRGLFDQLLPRSQNGPEGPSLRNLLSDYGFDSVQHEQIRSELRAGRLGLSQNRLPVTASIQDVRPSDLLSPAPDLRSEGRSLIEQGAIAVVSLAGGAGTRWTRGAGVVKALHPFARLAGKHRSFLEVHIAKCRRQDIPHIVTTSYLTHAPIADYYGENAPFILSPGRSIGLRMIPTARDLRFAWEEMPQQVLDVQAQKVRDSLRSTLIQWALQSGEASDYTDNVPLQCLHPTGHWFEVPNLLRNGVLKRLLDERPALRYLMVHNIDTLGADVDPALLALHAASGAALTFEVIHRWLDDRGGGLARVDGHVRLIEGLALPDERLEFDLTWYNSGTTWVDIDRFLELFNLTRADLAGEAKVTQAVRAVAARMPTYITIKDVKKRWGKGQEDVFPVAQWEKLWGDLTALPDLDCRFVPVPRLRGQQLKDVAQLDSWVRDGSAAYIEKFFTEPPS